MLKKSIFIVLAVLILLFGSCAPSQVSADSYANTPAPSETASAVLQTPQTSPAAAIATTSPDVKPEAKYIFYLIGDGMGEAHKQLSEEYLKYISGDETSILYLNSMDVNSILTTNSANAAITDSAAAASALATGVKTDNGMISLSPNGEPLTTLLETARDSGYATGVVTTTGVTHATPACFYAHNKSRLNEPEIAFDLLGSDIDFIAGGGLSFFLPKDLPESFLSLNPDARGMDVFSERADDIDLVSKFAEKGYELFIGPDGVSDFLSYTPNAADKVFAPLVYNYFPYEIDRLMNDTNLPSLSEVTKQAVNLLSLDEDGFFLMVEGGRIDYAAHNNDALGVIYEILAFDNVVRIALDFYEAHPNETLIITTADHETGGLKASTADFVNVSGVSASYGDGFAVLYDPEQTFDEFINGVNSLGLYPDDSELESLRTAFNEAMTIEYAEGVLDTAPALVINEILNRRIGVSWSTDYHTSANVALGVTGVFSDQFAAAHDNTDIANILAQILGVDIGLVQ